MLRITTENKTDRVNLKLEGTLDGLWVPELLESWREAKCLANGRTIRIDLTAVYRIDKAGEYLLALIRCGGSQLLGSGVLVNDLIQTIERDWAQSGAANEKVSNVQ